MKSTIIHLSKAFILCLLVSCNQTGKTPESTQVTAETNNTNSDFEIALDKSFYMSGSELNDLYINATITKGTINENTEIEIVKKSNTEERITGNIYRIDDSNFKNIKTANAGMQAVLYFKVNNDKSFPLSYTGDQYYLVKKGKKIDQTEAPKTEGMATIMVDGKEWKYDYYKIYHYTKNNGVTKSPASIVMTFTKKNPNLKNTPEELMEVIMFTDAKKPQQFQKSSLEITFNSEFDGQEKNYYRNKTFTEDASAAITQYDEANGKATLSGSFTSTVREFTCSTCPKKKIEIQFDKLSAELYNQ